MKIDQSSLGNTMRIISIHSELARIQKELNVPKNNTNSFGGYKYRSCEDILEALKPLLKDCTLTINDEVINIGERYYVKATVKLGLGDGEISVSAFARESQDKKGMDEAQMTGSASSYARKYALNGLFAIDDTRDADATNDGSSASPSKPQPKPTGIKAEIQQDMAKREQNANNDFLQCSDCGAAISEKVAKYSESKWGRPLCFDDQKKQS